MEIWVAHAWGSTTAEIARVVGDAMMPSGKWEYSSCPEQDTLGWAMWVRHEAGTIKFLHFDHYEVGEKVLRALALGLRPDCLIIKNDLFEYGGCDCYWHEHPPLNPDAVLGKEVVRKLREDGMRFPVILLARSSHYYDKDICFPEEWGVRLYEFYDHPEYREELARIVHEVLAEAKGGQK